ncbi:hypothetical protein [Cellulosilyticum ruminicola]|uniref:hypothetical protein n=1 Tax=Cellulosilyticum ruminicola TaxID=425254 RepID=UPI0006D01E75|nr:hypothetical protein [Cellulosilyticum ruminicola]
MAYRSNLIFGTKKKNRFLGVCIAITILGAALTICLLGENLFIASSINKNTASIETISKTTEDLRAEVQAVKEQKVAAEKELAELQDNLAKYEPVVIPDSMK